MHLNQKDKSLILFIIAILVVLWGIYSFFSYLFFSASFHSSDIKKITDNPNQQWFNVARPITADDLKERVILLEFWTYSCVSCIQSLPEIKELQEQFGNKLTVIGVHSASFSDEREEASVKKAILKYDITYPVVNDPDLKIWNAFKTKSWPTYVLINPRGNKVKTYSGEKDLSRVKEYIKKLISSYKFQINRENLPILLEKHDLIGNVLSFPSKLEYGADFSYKSHHSPVIFIANTGQNNIVVSSLSGDMIAKIGSGKEGFEDGSFEAASFRSPQGLLYDSGKLYVADSGNHALRLINFKEKTVTTLIGSGQRGEIIGNGEDLVDAKSLDLSSPSGLEFFPDKSHIAIANPGTHQILSYDLNKNTVSVIAGNGYKGIEDGKYPENSLSQTSDLSAFAHKLYFLDSGTSSFRVLDESGNVKTLIGTDLANSGHVNGDKSKALMQHALGLTVDDTGAYISDSFNHVIRKYDLSSGQLRDLVGAGKRGDNLAKPAQFDQPDGIISVLDRFYVADSNNNRVLMINRGSLNAEILNIIPPLKLPKEGFLQYLPNLQKNVPITLKTDTEIALKINLNNGWKINELGPSFINLLEMVNDSEANLISSFDWHSVKTAEMKLPKLKSSKTYLLQGSIYFCENKKNALCYVKSYEQKLDTSDGEKATEVEIKLGY